VINRLSPFLAAALSLGFVFLYGPIFSVIVYSFNASRLVTVWAGFSTRWYGELLENEQIKSAALTSFEIALLAASGALVLGTLAGFVLARYRRFAGRTLFGALVTGPLIMPEVITGLSLLLLFVALEQAVGWPRGRGVPTIDLRVDYHSAALPGDLTVRGKAVRTGGQFSTAEAHVYDAQGKLLASGRGTYLTATPKV